MEYLEYINFYIQIRNQLDEYMIGGLNDELTLNNIHIYFFNELERYVLESKTSLEILADILIRCGVGVEVEGNQISKTYSNYLKIRGFLNEEEDKHSCELFLITIKSYFEENEVMSKTSFLNFELIIKEALKNIKCYREIILFDYEEYLSVNKTINLVKNFFDEIDKSKQLSSSFLEFLNNENVFVWDVNNKEKLELLRKSKIGKTCNGHDYRESFVSMIGNELFANIYLENNLSDAYLLIHEFIHYYIIKGMCLEEESECSKFFSEFPSIFFEYLFNMYLEKNEFFEFDRDNQILDRQLENIKNVFMVSPAFKLYKIIKTVGDVDLESFYNEYTNSQEFKNYEEKAANVYRLLTEQIYDVNSFYDVLNVNFSNFTYLDAINYVSAMIFSEELISRIRNGNSYLVERMFDVINSLSYTQMDPLYILEYLELNYRFYKFKSAGDNVIPKRLEKKK